KKLQDIFVDAKIPREQRQSALLLLHAEEPLWVIGLRRCEGYGSVAGEPVLRIAMEPVKR
ncbi:MAG: tRNA lysidine(34) synthetase TilS, partial [Desulfuromonadales bacterium]|nr:tRNA lysidine(34) synthetase TilS [Desulfuromonadales bacterium]